MANPNKLSRFWQELKRRNVIRVTTVYAGAAFVILELVSMSEEPFGLPDWSFKLAVVILSAGFFAAIILSWIYDIHPKEGMVKTEADDKDKTEELQESFNNWKIASYISFVVIVGLIVLNIIPRINHTKELNKIETSIAVLPFENMSNNEDDSYLGGAFCDEIIMELQKIKAFDRVLSRTSTMQFEKDRPAIPEIAKILNVNYIVEGSIQRNQGRIRIRVQVIRAKNEDHIWGEEYDREWIDIFSIQDEIALHVASELQITLTPEEKKFIEKIPTSNFTAYELFQRGRDEHIKYWIDNRSREALSNAVSYYRSAILEDSTFAQAYTGLAMAIRNNFWQESWSNRIFSIEESELYRDSVLYLVNKALTYDQDLEEAYLVRGRYLSGKGEFEKALNEYNMALQINPNYADAYNAISWLMFWQKNNWIESIKYKLKAINLEKGLMLPNHLMELGLLYEYTGFIQKANEVYNQYLLITGDTTRYYELMAGPAWCSRNWNKYMYYIRSILKIDPDNYWAIEQSSYTHAQLGNIDTAYFYAIKLWEQREHMINYSFDIELIVGYTFWKMGMFDQSNRMIDKLVEFRLSLFESGENSTDYNLLYLAQLSAIRDRYEEAIMYLKKIDLHTVKPLWFLIQLENGPYLQELRTDKEFQSICSSINSVWQVEHERVRQWLEDVGL